MGVIFGPPANALGRLAERRHQPVEFDGDTVEFGNLVLLGKAALGAAAQAQHAGQPLEAHDAAPDQQETGRRVPHFP